MNVTCRRKAHGLQNSRNTVAPGVYKDDPVNPNVQERVLVMSVQLQYEYSVVRNFESRPGINASAAAWLVHQGNEHVKLMPFGLRKIRRGATDLQVYM